MTTILIYALFFAIILCPLLALAFIIAEALNAMKGAPITSISKNSDFANVYDSVRRAKLFSNTIRPQDLENDQPDQPDQPKAVG